METGCMAYAIYFVIAESMGSFIINTIAIRPKNAIIS